MRLLIIYFVCEFYPQKPAVGMNGNNSTLEMTNQEDKAKGNGKESKNCMGLLIASNL